MRKATQQQTKEHNRKLVLKTLFDHDRISRADIARRTTLTRTTVSDIVSEHIADGLVREVGVGSSLGGKSPIMLSLVAESRHVIGVDLAHDRFLGALTAPYFDLHPRVWTKAADTPPLPFTGLRVYRERWDQEERRRDPARVDRTLVFEHRLQ